MAAIDAVVVRIVGIIFPAISLVLFLSHSSIL